MRTLISLTVFILMVGALVPIVLIVNHADQYNAEVLYFFCFVNLCAIAHTGTSVLIWGAKK